MCACVLGFPGGSAVRIHQPMQETHETWVQSLDWKDPLEAEMTTHSRILAWRIPWMGEPTVHRIPKSWTEHAHGCVCLCVFLIKHLYSVSYIRTILNMLKIIAHGTSLVVQLLRLSTFTALGMILTSGQGIKGLPLWLS